MDKVKVKNIKNEIVELDSEEIQFLCDTAITLYNAYDEIVKALNAIIDEERINDESAGSEGGNVLLDITNNSALDTDEKIKILNFMEKVFCSEIF